MLNSILLIFMMLFDVLFIVTKGSLFWKTLASMMFVTIGFVNFIKDIRNKNNQILKFSIWMMAGIFYTMIADILLEIEFIFGAIFFGIGHMLFFISYTKLSKLQIKDMIYGIVLFIITITIVLFVNYINPIETIMFIVAIIYDIIISLMTGKSIVNYFEDKNELNRTILIGATLFFISDICLLLNIFGGFRIFRYPNLILYYLSLYYLGISMNKYN